jgi:hypothetical protein
MDASQHADDAVIVSSLWHCIGVGSDYHVRRAAKASDHVANAIDKGSESNLFHAVQNILAALDVRFGKRQPGCAAIDITTDGT